MRVATADLRALLYIRCFSERRMRCFELCFASTAKADLATLHCRRGAAADTTGGVRHRAAHSIEGRNSASLCSQLDLLDVAAEVKDAGGASESSTQRLACQCITLQKLAAAEGWAGAETAG